jgi:sodium borate transporter 11
MISDFKNYYYSDACTGDDNPLDPFLLLANATLNYTINGTTQLLSGVSSSLSDSASAVTSSTLDVNGNVLASNNNLNNIGNAIASSIITTCRRDSSLLFLLLMLGTVWVAITLYNFNKT